MFVIILLIIVLIYIVFREPKYSVYRRHVDVDDFRDDMKAIEQTPIKVGIYKTDEDIATYYSHFTNTTVSNVLSYSDVKMQYKSNLDNDNPVDNLVNSFISDKFPDKKKKDLLRTVRICTSPWDFKAHFDCNDNEAIMLQGSKRFLVFDMFNNKNEIKILEEIKKLSIQDTIPVLQKYKISNNLYTLNAGDLLFIKKGTYHKVEGNEPSILLNFTRNHGGSTYLDRFKRIWPKQKGVCKTNDCLY